MIFGRVATRADGTRKRLSTPFLVSVGVHLVVAIALMRMLILNGDFSPKARREASGDEHVGFVKIAKGGGVEKPVIGKSGGDGKPFTSREIHVVPPVSVPTTISVPQGPVTKVKRKARGRSSAPAARRKVCDRSIRIPAFGSRPVRS
jgi:hypothetical protein